MERAQHTPSVWIATFDDWIIKAGRLAKGEVLWMHDGRGLGWKDALLALNAQYGAGHFRTFKHGNALAVHRVTEPPPPRADAR